MTSSTSTDPFDVLGIAPTDDLSAVKRAYFSALKVHPPHSDPAGFRRLRAAYDTLLKPGALKTLSWTADFDRRSAIHTLDSHLAPRLDARARMLAHAQSSQALRATLERVITTSTWAELTAALAETETG